MNVNLQLMNWMLVALGYDFWSSEKRKKSVSSASEQVLLILMDVAMPVINGLESIQYEFGKSFKINQ